MNNKKWIIIVLILSLLGIAFVGVINYIVDPLQQYRDKTFYPIAFTNERYQNAGLSKNFKYDSLILGTSMTENFVIDEVEKYLDFKKVIKLSVAGGSAKEQSITVQTAIDNNKSLKNVLWGLDTFAFVGETNSLRYGENTFPFYLYDNNKFNDYKYILSLDTLRDSIRAIMSNYSDNSEKTIYDYNSMYKWQHPNDENFTLKNVYLGWKNRKEFINYEKNKQTFRYLKNNFDVNFFSIIKNNPQINFKIFFPPYSILAFKTFEERKLTNDILEFKEYIYNSLLSYDNVKIYDFQSEKNIIYDLNNYKDLYHYHERINTWLLQQIKVNNYLVKKENINEYLDSLKKEIEEYDLKEIQE